MPSASPIPSARSRARRSLQEKRTSSGWGGSIIEADETSVRVERKRCPKNCTLLSCKSNLLERCVGYRLLHRRFICICPRGERHLAMFFELPDKTCEATASGVSLTAEECDNILPDVLYPGKYILATDGAGAYQSVAPPSRVAYRTKKGESNVAFSKQRYEKYYKKLKLSHVIVSHKAEQWAAVDKVLCIGPRGARKTIQLKKGTQLVDGLWPELRESIPDPVHTRDWDRRRKYGLETNGMLSFFPGHHPPALCNNASMTIWCVCPCRSYIWSWVWRMRRSGKDHLVELGKTLRKRRVA